MCTRATRCRQATIEGRNSHSGTEVPPTITENHQHHPSTGKTIVHRTAQHERRRRLPEESVSPTGTFLAIKEESSSTSPTLCHRGTSRGAKQPQTHALQPSADSAICVCPLPRTVPANPLTQLATRLYPPRQPRIRIIKPCKGRAVGHVRVMPRPCPSYRWHSCVRPRKSLRGDADTRAHRRPQRRCIAITCPRRRYPAIPPVEGIRQWTLTVRRGVS